MTLSLNIGSPPVTLVQNGPVVRTVMGPGSAPVPGTLPLPSTAGTTLVAFVSWPATTTPTTSVNSLPAGWVRQVTIAQGSGALLEVWLYLSNPGGISTVSATVTSDANIGWRVHLSEWANVTSVGTLEASGTATATSGTTLTVTTGTNVLTAGDLALAAWAQGVTGAPPVVFTSPAGFTRLVADDGISGTSQGWLDIEYKIGPATGAPLSVLLTSDHTTISAAGAVIVLKASPPIADQSIYLVYGSLSLKLNTLDFALVDCPAAQQVMSTVTLSSPGEYPDWTGTVSQVQARDVVDIRSGHHFQVITATNTQLPNFTNAPFNISDNPATNTTDIWLLENGDMWQLENGSGDWLMESSVQENSYNSLSIGSQVGATSPAVTLTTLGNLTVPASTEQPNAVNLWPGMTFKLTSSNLANWITAPGSLYTIQTITITYQGANPPLPVFDVQFGIAVDTPTAAAIAAGAPVATWGGLFGRTLTLAEWTKAHAT